MGIDVVVIHCLDKAVIKDWMSSQRTYLNSFLTPRQTRLILLSGPVTSLQAALNTAAYISLFAFLSQLPHTYQLLCHYSL